MTCGACNPEAMRLGHGRVWGYTTAQTPTGLTLRSRDLYFMGAQAVFADLANTEPLDERDGFKQLSSEVYLRDGDKLILHSMDCLSDDPKQQDVALRKLEARGVSVGVLNEEYFEEN